MINKGDLFQSEISDTRPIAVLIEVVRTYDKRDIDPDCPESVAIIGMVEVLALSGSTIGRTYRYPRRHFYRLFSPVPEAE